MMNTTMQKRRAGAQGSLSMTEGKPYRQIVRFAIPLLLGSLIQQLYSTVDAFVISRALGVSAFAGVSSTAGITFLVLGFAQGMMGGLAIAIAQAFGAGDRPAVRRQYLHNLLICLAAGVFLSAVSLAGTDLFLDLLQTPADIRRYARDYLQIFFGGIIASMFFNFFASTLRALGDSRSPLRYLLIAAVLNIGLDVLLVACTPLGVKGAAWATVFSQGVSALLCLRKILRQVDILSLRGYREGVRWRVFAHNLRLGLPMGFQSSIIALGVVAMQFATNGLGSTAVAAYGVSVKIDNLAVEPILSLGMAMTTFAAQNAGDRQYGRVLQGVRQGVAISLGMAAVLGALMCGGGRGLTALFIGWGEGEILRLSHALLILHGAFYAVLGLLIVLRSTLQGLGHTVVPTLAGIMELAMRVLAAFVLVPRFQYMGAAAATPLSWLGALLPVAIAFFFVGRGLRRKANERGKTVPAPPLPRCRARRV